MVLGKNVNEYIRERWRHYVKNDEFVKDVQSVIGVDLEWQLASEHWDETFWKNWHQRYLEGKIINE